MRKQLRWRRSELSEPLCVNFVLAFEQTERLKVALEERAAVVSFSSGIDEHSIKLAKDAGSLVLVQEAM